MELVDATAPRIVVAGEGMIELSRDGSGWCVRHGGDTLNLAIHLARFGLAPAYLTALGDDPFSADLRDTAWPAEGLDTSLILTDLRRGPGLYAITTDPAGERHFTYWRRDSAASAMFSAPGIEAAVERSIGAELFVYSLISLAILDDAGRAAMIDLAARVRDNGGKVVFDANYRPRLWEDGDTARQWHDRAVANADIGLPTLEDEALLGNESDAATVAAQWQALGCAETVVKLGAEGCRLPDGTVVAPAQKLDAVDTSGAGDSFDAGYLAARLGGASPADAARIGNALAGWVVMRRGAIPPRDATAPYDLD